MSQLAMLKPDLESHAEVPDLPEGYRLRTATASDRDQLSQLLHAAFAPEAWSPEMVDQRLLMAPDVSATFLIEIGSEAVATASAQIQDRAVPRGTVHWVAAHPEHGGKRLGGIVSLAVLHRFKEMGMRDAQLTTDDDRLPAIRTYLNLGFIPWMRDETHEARWRAVSDRLAISLPGLI